MTNFKTISTIFCISISSVLVSAAANADTIIILPPGEKEMEVIPIWGDPLRDEDNDINGKRKTFTFEGSIKNPDPVFEASVLLRFDYLRNLIDPIEYLPSEDGRKYVIGPGETLDFKDTPFTEVLNYCPISASFDVYNDNPFNLELKNLDAFTHICEPNELKPNGQSNLTTGSNSNGNEVTFNSQTGELSFTSYIIDYANASGDESFDPIFSNDPIIGATIEVTNMILSGPTENGFLFEDGTLVISKDENNFLTADIPSLIVNDQALTSFNHNIFGLLQITDYDLSSQWIENYINFTLENQSAPAELFIRTSEPLGEFIENGITVTINNDNVSISNSPKTSEPITILGLLVFGGAGLLSSRKKMK